MSGRLGSELVGAGEGRREKEEDKKIGDRKMGGELTV